MGNAADHIDEWLADGLIDEATAQRLRTASAEEGGADEGTDPAGDAPRLGDPTSAGAIFGPSVTISEMFGYLGAIFLLAAWAAFLGRIASDSNRDLGLGATVAAVVLAFVGAWLGTGSPRRSRAVGVLFLASTVWVAVGTNLVAQSLRVSDVSTWIVGSGVALVVATAFRLIHPSVLTHVGLLGALTGLAAAALQWIDAWIVGDVLIRAGSLERDWSRHALLVVGHAMWWLGTALILGYLGLREARRASVVRGAGPRASISRLWAGVVAVLGLTSAVTTTGYTSNMEWGRILPVWLGDLALLVLSAVLIERAFRRDAATFIWAAALGVIIALSDLNVEYVSDGTDVALLVEGAILLLVGFWAELLRLRLKGPDPERATSAS